MREVLVSLPGAAAVYLASPEAKFLQYVCVFNSRGPFRNLQSLYLLLPVSHPKKYKNLSADKDDSGRFVFASWDVDELKTGELRRIIDEDAEFLKIGVHGIKGNGNRKW